MSNVASSVQDSVGTTEYNLQSRLVSTASAFNPIKNTDNDASSSLIETDQDLGSIHHHESHDHPLQETTKDLASTGTDRVATKDEIRDLLHVVDSIPVRLWVAALAGVLERFVWYGATAPLRESTLE